MDIVLTIIIVSVILAIGVGFAVWYFMRPAGQAGHKTAHTTISAADTRASNSAGGLPVPTITDEMLARIEAQAVDRYNQVINTAASRFENDLAQTSTTVADSIKRLTSSIITEELEKYKHSLEDLRTQALQVMASVQAAVEDQRKTLAAGLEAEMKGERQRLAAQLDTKLADIVSAYLVESLGNKVDLGAQGQYLFAMLAEHKEEIKQEFIDEV